jgi:hypothetical protein
MREALSAFGLRKSCQAGRLAQGERPRELLALSACLVTAVVNVVGYDFRHRIIPTRLPNVLRAFGIEHLLDRPVH